MEPVEETPPTRVGWCMALSKRKKSRCEIDNLEVVGDKRRRRRRQVCFSQKKEKRDTTLLLVFF